MDISSRKKCASEKEMLKCARIAHLLKAYPLPTFFSSKKCPDLGGKNIDRHGEEVT